MHKGLNLNSTHLLRFKNPAVHHIGTLVQHAVHRETATCENFVPAYDQLNPQGEMMVSTFAALILASTFLTSPRRLL